MTTPPPSPKRLYRSTTDQMLGGVAAGLAHYFEMDPTLMRFIFIVAAVVTGGLAALVYFAAWIIVPEDNATPQAVVSDHPAASGQTTDNRRKIGGTILVTLGLIFLFGEFVDVDIWDNLWPLIPIALGLSIILRRR